MRTQNLLPMQIVKIEPGVGSSRKRPSINDLPAGTKKAWQRLFLPMLREHVGTLLDPWSSNEIVPDMQRLWTQVFADVPRTLGLGEPIFALVCIFVCDAYKANTFLNRLHRGSQSGEAVLL